MTKKIPDMVVKSNALIEGYYRLELNELRLLDIALADLTTYAECEKEVTTLPDMISIRAEQYAELYNVSTDMAYLALRDASEKLFFRYFSYPVKSDSFPTHKEIRKARWVQEIGYIEGQGVVTLSFSNTLIDLAGRLSGNFSRYHLEQKAPLTSIYAHRLYEMMMQWRGDKEVPYITYFELRNRLMIAETQYARTTNFRARVLDPAIKQINEHTDVTVSYTQVMKGRNVEGFTFVSKMKKSAKPLVKSVNKIKDANKTASADKPVTKRTPKKIPPMTSEQRNTFAFKLLKLFDFTRDYSSSTYGKSQEEVILWIEQGLADDEKRQEWHKYILMAGYEFPHHIKK